MASFMKVKGGFFLLHYEVIPLWWKWKWGMDCWTESKNKLDVLQNMVDYKSSKQG